MHNIMKYVENSVLFFFKSEVKIFINQNLKVKMDLDEWQQYT